MEVRVLLVRSHNGNYELFLPPNAQRTNAELPGGNGGTKTAARRAIAEKRLFLGAHRLSMVSADIDTTYFGGVLFGHEVVEEPPSWNSWVDILTVIGSPDQYGPDVSRAARIFADRLAAEGETVHDKAA